MDIEFIIQEGRRNWNERAYGPIWSGTLIRNGRRTSFDGSKDELIEQARDYCSQHTGRIIVRLWNGETELETCYVKQYDADHDQYAVCEAYQD